MSLKDELQSIISGNGKVRNGKITQAITYYLRRKKKAISASQKAKFVKEQETKVLLKFIESKDFWYRNLDESKYIGEGS